MADKLTPQQKQAVFNRGGNLLISAAAGSGKTKVLVDRLLSYLMDESDPANLDEFLIITYTKAAASELSGKIAAKLTQQIAEYPENRHLQKQMQRLFLAKISTVHGFCGDLLREYAYRLDIPADFRVADESECREIRDVVMQELLDQSYENGEDNSYFLAFTDSQGLGRDDRLIPEIIEKVYDSARCHLDPQGWLQNCLDASDIQDTEDASQTVWGMYLIQDLHAYLDSQMHILSQCILALDASEGMEKAAVNIRSTLVQLEELRHASSWDAIVKQRNIDYGRLTFPRKNADPELTERVKAARNACKKGLERKLHSFADPSERILQDMDQLSAATHGLVQLVKQFEQRYQSAKHSRRVLDFSDLEHKTLDLLLGKSRTNPTAAAKEIGNRFREILVDEYQDSNGVQDAIFSALTREKKNCFLVGDVKQSIYQFRLADPGIFLEKYRTFLPAEDALPGQDRKVMLSHNFRSGPEVISAVNDVFRSCMSPDVGGLQYGDAEALREGLPHQILPNPAVELYAIDVRENTYQEEADFVADQILTMLQSGTKIRKEDGWKSVTPDDIVILLRSPGSAGSYFQRALESRGIRCASGGGTDILQTEEVGTLRAFLQAIQNPRLDIPLISTLASPVFGFTADDLAKFRSCQRRGSVYDALLLSDEPKAIHFLNVLSILRKENRRNTLTGLLERCFTLTRFDSIYSAMEDGETRSSNLQQFYQIAADYEKGNLRDVGEFLDYLDTLEERGLVTAGATGTGCVNIMSIHKSKGLEFPVVFLCNLSRKFNLESIRAQILCDRELGLGLSVADHKNRIRYPSIAKRAIAAKMMSQSVSEELRVLYVAMTRARDKLIMTYAAQRLESDLQDIALRMDFDGGQLLSRDAICLGDWVLFSALQKTEAGELHAIAGTPLDTKVSDFPWKISLTEAPIWDETGPKAAQKEKLPEGTTEKLREALTFQYPNIAATTAPSKRTATDRKGRSKDAEAAENALERYRPVRNWRKPAFLNRGITGKAYGNAIHAAMQYLQYKNCGSKREIQHEIQRLVQQGFLSEEQGSLVNYESLYCFFASEIGAKLRNGVPHLREFKFSILDNGSNYGEELEGEQVLLQGVVDCALFEPDGITVVDFKTDNVSEETLMTVTERYRPQIQTYGEALNRIYEMPVKKQYLYFFRLNRFVEV